MADNDIARKITPPIGVYYDASTEFFRGAWDTCTMDNDFQVHWRHHKALFPQSREAALEAFAAASPTPEELEHALRFSRPFVMPENGAGKMVTPVPQATVPTNHIPDAGQMVAVSDSEILRLADEHHIGVLDGNKLTTHLADGTDIAHCVLNFARALSRTAPVVAEGWKLDFRPSSETPTEPGDYILFNQCDGYHIVEAWFDDGEFSDFWVFAASQPASKDFYCAWAKLPDTLKDLYPKFAKDSAAEQKEKTS